MAGVFRVHSWSLACLCQAQTLRCLDLHLAAGDWGQNAEGWRVYTKIPPFFAATTHDRRYPKWWVEANTNGFFLELYVIYMCFQSVPQHWSFQLPSLVAKHRCQTRMACKYIWGEVKELNGEQKTATYKCRPQWSNHSADLLQQERLKNPGF